MAATVIGTTQLCTKCHPLSKHVTPEARNGRGRKRLSFPRNGSHPRHGGVETHSIVATEDRRPVKWSVRRSSEGRKKNPSGISERAAAGKDGVNGNSWSEWPAPEGGKGGQAAGRVTGSDALRAPSLSPPPSFPEPRALSLDLVIRSLDLSLSPDLLLFCVLSRNTWPCVYTAVWQAAQGTHAHACTPRRH